MKSCEQMDLPTNPPSSKSPEDLLSQAEWNNGKGQNDEHKEPPLRCETSDDDKAICIEILKMELDMHKQAMIELDMHKKAMKETLAERMNSLCERDCTIKTQCFLIATLDQSVQELLKERTNSNQQIADLRNQLVAFTSRDWQSSSGTRKKRKLSE